MCQPADLSHSRGSPDIVAFATCLYKLLQAKGDATWPSDGSNSGKPAQIV